MTAPRDPYNWVESWAWPAIERGDVPSFAALVLLRLAAHANREGIAWPSGRKLAEMVGRSERRVRTALVELRNLGLIDGEPTPRKSTRWRLITDAGERKQLGELRTRTPQEGDNNCCQSADTGSADTDAATEADLRTICDLSANPSRGEGEGEETPLSLHTEARDVGEGEVIDFVKTLAQSLSMDRKAANA
jgi:Helix-turn-helix domain